MSRENFASKIFFNAKYFQFISFSLSLFFFLSLSLSLSHTHLSFSLLFSLCVSNFLYLSHSLPSFLPFSLFTILLCFISTSPSCNLTLILFLSPSLFHFSLCNRTNRQNCVFIVCATYRVYRSFMTKVDK